MENNKGFVPVIIAIAVVLAVGVGGYFVFKNNSSAPLKSVKLPGVKLPSVAGLNPECKFKDPDLCKHLNRYASLAQAEGGFSGKSVTTDKTGKKTESLWEMDGATKSHFLTTENGKEAFNTIIIADTTYTKDPQDNKWWKYVASKEKGGVNTNFFNPEDLKSKFQDTLKNVEDKTSYKKIGKEKCGSMTCFKYQVMSPDFADAKEYLYFDDKEYLMRMMRVEAGDSVTETSFDYNKVSIKAPSPVKDGEPAFNTFFNTPTSEEAVPTGFDTTQLQEEMKKILETSSTGE